MEIVNKIKEGLHQDNVPYEQPDNTIRDSLNGIITDLGNGNYKWSNQKSTFNTFSILGTDLYFAHCTIRDRLFVITLDTINQIVKIFEITFVDTTGTALQRYSGSNVDWNLSVDHPIRAIWGFYENDDIQRIYFTDWNNNPRVINVNNDPIITIDPKFFNFTPVIENVYGKFEYVSQATGGSLKAGTHFFAWRYYTDQGYYTDWSYLSNPIQVTDGVLTGDDYNSYQIIQGEALDSNTGKKVTVKISDIDTDYDNIQVCSFYSNDLNITAPGTIFYDGPIDVSGIMTFNLLGSENLGTVLLDDLIITTLVVEKCKDMTYGKKMNIISNIEERAELDAPAYIETEISPAYYSMVADTTGYPSYMVSAFDDKALFGMRHTYYDEFYRIIRFGQWYYATSETTFTINTLGVPDAQIVAAGRVFMVTGGVGKTITGVSGLFKGIHLIRKYVKTGGSYTCPAGDDTNDYVNNDWVFDYVNINDYPDYKSAISANYVRGYPMGEKIRLGIVFFDNYGKPYFARYLKNKAGGSYDEGDIRMPMRYTSSGASNKMLELNYLTLGSDGFVSDQVNFRVASIDINDLDLTDVIDDISGFMIVRAPIIHQYLGMGLLTYVYKGLAPNESADDLYSSPRISSDDTSDKLYEKTYALYCPEDVFGLKEFVLSENYELENLEYLKSFNNTEKYKIGSGYSPYNFKGFGRAEVDVVAADRPIFYQKLFLEDYNYNLACVNGRPYSPGNVTSHKITSVTKYNIGDPEVGVDPLDPTKLYQPETYHYWDGAAGVPASWHRGSNNTHSIVVLDIDEGFGKGKKAYYGCPEDDPSGLLVAVKNPNSDPYGGFDEASIANTTYIAVGHFQEINNTVKSQVLSGGRYIFNHIQIFGGDTFMGFFDTTRYYFNDDASGYYGLGHSIVMPVESRINLAMRDGMHVAKDRSYQVSYNPDGLRMKVGETNYEEFSYNDGYSTDNIHDEYVPMPFRFTSNNVFDARIRFSNTKTYEEQIDNFRIFGSSNYLDVNTNAGEINNIRFKNDKVVYWQPDEVGYIPIYERALTQNSVGQAVQLGTGGMFERYDQIVDKVGNSNQFGLVESPLGYHWYDAKRKIFYSLSNNLQFDYTSIVRGIDTFFRNTVLDNLRLYDNPRFTYGCFGAYDPISKIVYYSFIMTSGPQYTIGLNIMKNTFVGYFNYNARDFFTYIGKMIGVATNLINYHMLCSGVGYGEYFGLSTSAYVTFIVKENSNEAKIFDNFELIGNQNFFNDVIYSNSEQSINEVDIVDYNPGLIKLNRNYNYKKRRWYFNAPKVSRERLSDGYLMIKFRINDPALVELYELKSHVRKQY